MKTVFVLLLAFVLFSPSVSAFEKCSSTGFGMKCSYCDMDKYGSMNAECESKYDSTREECFLRMYPNAALGHIADKCPAVDTCLYQLRECLAEYCDGSDAQNCMDRSCFKCFEDEDLCMYMASMDCEDEEQCGNRECVAEKGEDEDTCCKDCGCSSGLECKNNECVEIRPCGDKKCDKTGGEDCRTCWQDCGCSSYKGYECIPGVEEADEKGCVYQGKDYDKRRTSEGPDICDLFGIPMELTAILALGVGVIIRPLAIRKK